MNNLSPLPDLLAAIEAHCVKTGIKESTFGHVALNDPNFVRNLKDGREPRRKTVARAFEFILTGKTYAEAKAMADNHSVDVLPDGSPALNDEDAPASTVSQGATIHTQGNAA